jgi:hypothetical protein
MSPLPADEEPTLAGRSRWLVVGALSLLALPVVFSFFFFGLVAADGAVVGVRQGQSRPVLAAALAGGAAVMAGGWAGLVPWAMGRGDLVARTFVAAFLLVAGLFGLLALVA